MTKGGKKELFFKNHAENVLCFTCAWPKIISFPPEYVENR